MKYKAKNAGFTLVELMVALLVGLLIMLGASQLYLTGSRNFHDVQTLSDRQAALTYAADILIQDIRRADLKKNCSIEDNFEVSLHVNGECHYYGLDVYPDSGEVSLRININGEGWQPIVGGFKDIGSFSVLGISGGLFEISFSLVGESEDLIFHAQNRSVVFN